MILPIPTLYIHTSFASSTRCSPAIFAPSAGGSAMSESKGLVKHVLLAKFKEDVSPERQDQLIKGYAALVPLIQPMKAFSWGRNVSIENLDQGFTHVFESYFDSVEGIAEYVAHPVHVEFASEFLGALEKVLIVDYTPTNVSLP